MNLGALVTIADKRPTNFYHFLLDNECYATTGGQPVPNAENVDYALIAKGAGYPSTYAFDDLEDLATSCESILAEPGPVFVAMKIVAEIENRPIGQRRRWQTRSLDQVLRELKAELSLPVA